MSVLFSVLLPTRNGGEFLGNCIESILRDPRDDVELVVSDNANTDATVEVLSRWAGDQRLKVVRQTEVLSVTDNWNAALHQASGEYLLMMGDDDYLLPDYFSSMTDLIKKYDHPDCILYNACSYVAPNSIGEDGRSYFSPDHFHFGADFQTEHMLDAEARYGIVRDMFDFRVRIPLNMQTTLVRRSAAESVPGGVFQAPFPDHFALNSMLLGCENWLFSPEHFVVVGVSPKSFGHYVYSNQQGNGLSYLGITSDFEGRLPGNELLNGMHVWLSMLKRAYPEQLNGVELDRRGYVRRQVYAWLMQFRLGAISGKTLAGRFRSLSFKDMLGLPASLLDTESWRRFFRIFGLARRSDAEQQWAGLIPLDDVQDIAQFVSWYVRDRASP